MLSRLFTLNVRMTDASNENVRGPVIELRGAFPN